MQPIDKDVEVVCQLAEKRQTLSSLRPDKEASLVIALFGIIHRDVLETTFPAIRPLGERFQKIETFLQKKKPYEDLATDVLQLSPYSGTAPHIAAARAIVEMLASSALPKIEAIRLNCSEITYVSPQLQTLERDLQADLETFFQLTSRSTYLKIPIESWIKMEARLCKTFALLHEGQTCSYWEAFCLWGNSLKGDCHLFVQQLERISVLGPLKQKQSLPFSPLVELTSLNLTFSVSFKEWLADRSVIAILKAMQIDVGLAPFFPEIKTLFVSSEEGRRSVLYALHKQVYDPRFFQGQPTGFQRLASKVCHFQLSDSADSAIQLMTYWYCNDLPLTPESGTREETLSGLSDGSPHRLLRGKARIFLSVLRESEGVLSLLQKLPKRSYENNLHLLECLMKRTAYHVLFLNKLLDCDPSLRVSVFVDRFVESDFQVEKPLYDARQFFEAYSFLKTTKPSFQDCLEHVESLLRLDPDEVLNYLSLVKTYPAEKWHDFFRK